MCPHSLLRQGIHRLKGDNTDERKPVQCDNLHRDVSLFLWYLPNVQQRSRNFFFTNSTYTNTKTSC